MSTLVVFSHPNHELAIFGLLQRRRPSLVYLTDGGGPERLDQTRRGLTSIGLLDQAVFLNHTEQRLYDALLDRDLSFYGELAQQVRGVIEHRQPADVLCDAVEFYNPVHDIALPVTRAALEGRGTTALYEVPLIHQRPSSREEFAVQRARASQSNGIELRLSDDELAAKKHARDRIYRNLADQLGPVMSSLPDEHLRTEVIVPASALLPAPDSAVVLRYERRAALLKARGNIEREITYAVHYLPVAASLAGQAS